MTRGSAIFPVLVGLAFLPRAATAEPSSRWDRIRDPAIGRAEDALGDALDTRVTPVEGYEEGPAIEYKKLKAFEAAANLELRGGAALPSAELWYFLGSSLVFADRGQDEEGRRLLRQALEADPGSPLAAHAWFEVALASDKLHDFQAERDAYAEALRTEWSEDERATILSNRAEAAMDMGDLGAARADYLSALGLVRSTGSEVFALASWGLAVAYARDDDLPDALKYAGVAASMLFPAWSDAQKRLVPTPAIDLPTVSYTPEYEIFYYRALGEMASAEKAGDAAHRAEALLRAIADWDEYLGPAGEKGDRWIQNAEFQRRWCIRRLPSGIRPPSASRNSTEGSGSRSRRPRPTRARD